MELFFDTESSGLWRDSLPPDHPSQPHLLSLAAILCTGERIEGRMSAIVRPTDWTIELEAEAVHGITAKRANRVGLPLAEVLLFFRSLVQQAQTVVAHHLNFDRRMIERALAEIQAGGSWWNNRAGWFCTMEESTRLCRLPGQFGDFKFPTLEEAHDALFPLETWRSRHDAEEDTLMCARIYRAIAAGKQRP